MPDLPTLTLSQEHYDRVVAAFPGTTSAEKVAAYRAWSFGHLIDFVKSTEFTKISEQHRVQMEAAMASLNASLPPRPVYPPPLT
jgi:uncharacterized protein (DUF1499 family)